MSHYVTIDLPADVARQAGYLLAVGPQRWNRQDWDDAKTILEAVRQAVPWDVRYPKSPEGQAVAETVALLGKLPRAGKPARLAVVG